MKKTLLALGIVSTMVAGSAMAADSGTIGTGTMTVNGSVNNSTCSVSFPTSLTMPVLTKTQYDATKYQDIVLSQMGGNITFSGCDGKTVNIKVAASGGQLANQSSFYFLPNVAGKSQGYFGLGLLVQKDSNTKVQVNVDGQADTDLSFLSIKGSTYQMPVGVQLFRLSNLPLDSSFGGTYSVPYVFTATYA